jgi:ATP-dependent helicase HrpA
MGDLPELMELERAGQTLVGYPALVDAGDGVTLQVFD